MAEYLRYLFGDEPLPTFEYDLIERKIVRDCALSPTESIWDSSDWLYALNNKFGRAESEKTGKWTFTCDRSTVDGLWAKIKDGVKGGRLWESQVTMVEPEKFFVCVYTKDVFDWDDSVGILKYLEEEIGVVHTEDDPIFYVSNCPVLEKGTKLFRSDAKQLRDKYSEIMKTEKCTSIYDDGKVIVDCNLKPTQVYKTQTEWLQARNNKETNVDPQKVGKWMLFPKQAVVDDLWEKIKSSVKGGHLWKSVVSTRQLVEDDSPVHAILIFTRDYEDLDDIVKVLDHIERSGWMMLHTIYYKTDDQSRAGIYSRCGHNKRPWMYSSWNVRHLLRRRRGSYPSWRVRHSDISTREVPRNMNRYLPHDSDRYPTEVPHNSDCYPRDEPRRTAPRDAILRTVLRDLRDETSGRNPGYTWRMSRSNSLN